MVVAYHLIWTAYGWWLPNDPRGSMSKEVRPPNIVDLGEIHFGRKRIQPAGWVLRDFQKLSAISLEHELLKLRGDEAKAVAQAFSDVVSERTYTCYACAIMPEHIHLLIRKHRDSAEQMIQHFQRKSRIAVCRCGLRPIEHEVWGGPGWKVFLDSRRDIERTIDYIEQNPIKIGMPRQQWGFVRAYDGWMPGIARFAKPQASGRRNNKE